MNQIEQYLIFGQAARAGSFRRAADHMGVSNSHISKHIARLEQSLGYKLFHRSPQLQLTESGRALLPEVESMITSYEQLSQVAPALKGEPTGLVRVGLPPLLAHEMATPALAKLLRNHTGLKLELNLQQSTLQAFQHKLDLVVTLGSLPDSSLVCQRIIECDTVLVASPAYLAEHGMPTRPEDLKLHSCLASNYPHFENLMPWEFIHKDGEAEGRHTVEINTKVSSNDIHAVRTMVENHAGIGVMLRFAVKDALARGDLLPVLKDYHIPIKPPIYIVYHDRELLPKSVTLVKDVLVNAIREGVSSTH